MRIRHPLILASVCLGYFMAVLDSTVVNVALPDMARSLGTGIAGMQWVVDGYALLFASLLLMAGTLGDRWGNKETFAAGLGPFTLASGLCGIAPNLGTLIAFRAVQGVGAAVQVPASLALLRHHYHDARERAEAVRTWAAATGRAAGAGAGGGGGVAAAYWYDSERRAEHPMLPLELFRDSTFSAATAVGAILSFGFYGELFLMSLFFQQVQHRTALAAGLALLPQTAVVSLANFVSGQLTARYGSRPPMVVGLAIGGIGLGGLALITARASLAAT